MSEYSQQFGGSWTDQKLDCLQKYLHAYATIFNANQRAKFFTTIYLDAFAGTGYRVANLRTDEPIPADEEPTLSEEEKLLLKGSARIALELEPGFKRYIFVERDPSRVEELKRLRDEFPSKDILVEHGDANTYIQTWTAQTDWEKHRAVVFLDPYGMQVQWRTIQSIADTRAIDLWFLFPAGIAVSRMLPKDKPPPDSWGRRLTELFGSEEWRDRFYTSSEQETLFGAEETLQRDASLANIGNFLIERLETAFDTGGVLRQLMVLRNSRRSPMYLLCFACGNPRAKGTALKIAGDLVTKYTFAEFLSV
ncbi:MAG: three-Cys-motif partner protein TcmP [Anaerolineae bacterium]|nr:three-Cys-motif partner protein TcmP [Anaerolineae bacterium]